jgi:hypothetical protein
MKEILKSRKFIYAAGTIVLTVVAHYVPNLNPEIPTYILSVGIALITGHTISDVAATIKRAQKNS